MPEVIGSRCCHLSRLVHPGADFIFVDRDETPEAEAAARSLLVPVSYGAEPTWRVEDQERIRLRKMLGRLTFPATFPKAGKARLRITADEVERGWVSA